MSNGKKAVITLERKRGSSDILRAYHIKIDNQEYGIIRQGEKKNFEVTPGKHVICLTMDWVSSPSLHVEVESGEQRNFICQSPKVQHGFFLGLIVPHSYIILQEE